ncbi:MAG: DUF4266 domain-containing protein [Gammaproteobacteria bacterium]|jgi:hypothetical protein|nr:hypothetical protein [Gammaproteobacteria bacterium]MDP6095407.1 DUF4266 domain-containing protein [Gammaproteobacteria bacterium]|tara:strand:+ start:1651 stop:1869 length:219 start_codon:yes stop_codon:yes gene_type:complete
MNKLRLLLILLTSLCLLSACTPVRPWERGYLAKEEMAWDRDSLERVLNDHIFFSKEASSGGNSAAGGGCGCN